MGNSLIDKTLGCYAGWLNKLAAQLGCRTVDLRAVAIILIALLLMSLWILIKRWRVKADSDQYQPEVKTDSESSGLVDEIAGSCEQDLALAEAYLEMREFAKAKQCLAKIDEQLPEDNNAYARRIQQLRQRLDKSDSV